MLFIEFSKTFIEQHRMYIYLVSCFDTLNLIVQLLQIVTNVVNETLYFILQQVDFITKAF